MSTFGLGTVRYNTSKIALMPMNQLVIIVCLSFPPFQPLNIMLHANDPCCRLHFIPVLCSRFHLWIGAYCGRNSPTLIHQPKIDSPSEATDQPQTLQNQVIFGLMHLIFGRRSNHPLVLLSAT